VVHRHDDRFLRIAVHDSFQTNFLSSHNQQLPLQREQNGKQRRELPVPGIIPETEPAKEAKVAKDAIADAPRLGVFRNGTYYAPDGCNALRDKDIPEGKNPHGCGCILPA
jgi:hypothetical protein